MLRENQSASRSCAFLLHGLLLCLLCFVAISRITLLVSRQDGRVPFPAQYAGRMRTSDFDELQSKFLAVQDLFSQWVQGHNHLDVWVRSLAFPTAGASAVIFIWYIHKQKKKLYKPEARAFSAYLEEFNVSCCDTVSLPSCGNEYPLLRPKLLSCCGSQKMPHLLTLLLVTGTSELSELFLYPRR